MSEMRGHLQRGMERRAAILEAAMDLFGSTGFHGTGLSALADKVGITAPAILHHFGSKQNLLFAVLEEFDRRVEPLFGLVSGPGGLETLRRMGLVAEAMSLNARFPGLHLLLEAEHLEEAGPVRDYLIDRARNLRDLMATAVRQGQERGEIDPTIDPVAIGAEVHAFIDGAARAWLVDRDLDLVALVHGYLTPLLERLAV